MAKSGSRENNGAVMGFEQPFWQAADKLHSRMGAAEYKHVMSALIFRRYIPAASTDHSSIRGQEPNRAAWHLPKMDLAICVFDANLGPQHAGTFRRGLAPDIKTNYLLANPPLTSSGWAARIEKLLRGMGRTVLLAEAISSLAPIGDVH
jgi:type I restriction-modification system DNA methylase subunit